MLFGSPWFLTLGAAIPPAYWTLGLPGRAAGERGMRRLLGAADGDHSSPPIPDGSDLRSAGRPPRLPAGGPAGAEAHWTQAWRPGSRTTRWSATARPRRSSRATAPWTGCAFPA